MMTPAAFFGALMLWAAGMQAASGTGAPDGLVQPIYTRQTVFAIPFKIDLSASRATRDPIQVLLYVSTNRGSTWELNSQAEPEKGHFLFRAGSDGEFWFVLRTAIQGTRLAVPTHEKPGLRVIVDTVAPKLELAAERGSNGQVIVRWRVTEAHLKPESLTIQYRSESETHWQSVTVDRPSPNAEGTEFVGEVTWWQPSGVDRVEIRGEVADLAGNTAVSHAQLSANLAAGPRPRPAPNSITPGRLPAEAAANNGLPQLNSPERPGQSRLPSSAWRPVRSPQGPAATMIHSRAASVVASPPTESTRPAQRNASSPRFRIVNSRTFALEYDPGPGPSSGELQVEFWGTHDGGRTWLNYGADPDRRSPMLITVAEDGVYGFRARVRSPGDEPRHAEPNAEIPDVWVIVNRHVPVSDSPLPSSPRIVDARPVTPDRPENESGL